MKITIAKIWWKDASLHGNLTFAQEDIKDFKLIDLFTCGVLIKKNRDFIVTAMDFHPIDKSFRSVTVTPMSCIKKVEYEQVEV